MNTPDNNHSKPSKCTILEYSIIAIIVIVGIVAWKKGTLIIDNIKTAFGSAEKVTIDFNDQGTTIIKRNDVNEKASLLLSASDLWANSGLMVPAKKCITITASGKAQIAINDLIKNAEKDNKPNYLWTGPNGYEGTQFRAIPGYYSTFRILPEAPDGALLAYLQAPSDGEPDPGLNNPRPHNLNRCQCNDSHIFVIKNQAKICNTWDDDRRLWFVINDSVIENNLESKTAYIAAQKFLCRKSSEYEESKKNKSSYIKKNCTEDKYNRSWNNIVEQQYWNIWYDDNIGFFSIQINFDT
ncbi:MULTISPECIES: hypothetical protein [Methylomonas]|uniref:Uncharacterized protein n=1 Tax=Methylomonas koyamae TaxID=702114 RepID=A0A177N1S8_9GAMM|nr:hypothetical protein [Methylomonas koyamae]OAI11927.1 hypothetical protein A1355_14850 [Methylomonas koyamae]